MHEPNHQMQCWSKQHLRENALVRYVFFEQPAGALHSHISKEENEPLCKDSMFSLRCKQARNHQTKENKSCLVRLSGVG
jgi:hypothetical protein